MTNKLLIIAIGVVGIGLLTSSRHLTKSDARLLRIREIEQEIVKIRDEGLSVAAQYPDESAEQLDARRMDCCRRISALCHELLDLARS